jgi:hypothetical protein
MWKALSNPTKIAAKGLACAGENIAMPHCNERDIFVIARRQF